MPRVRDGAAAAAASDRMPQGRLPAGGPRPNRHLADTVFYEVHVKGITQRHPGHSGRDPRHLRRVSRTRRCSTSSRAGRHRGGTAARCTTTCPRRSCVDRGLTNYWGYNTIGFFAPHAGVLGGGPGRPAGRGGRGIPDDGRRAARRRARGRARRRLQPHRGGRARVARPSACAVWTTRPTTGSTRTAPRHYVDTSGCGNGLNVGQSRLPAADHGLAAVLGDRDGRRRVPVRPGAGAGPAGGRVRRRRPRSSTSSGRTR